MTKPTKLEKMLALTKAKSLVQGVQAGGESWSPADDETQTPKKDT